MTGKIIVDKEMLLINRCEKSFWIFY